MNESIENKIRNLLASGRKIEAIGPAVLVVRPDDLPPALIAGEDGGELEIRQADKFERIQRAISERQDD